MRKSVRQPLIAIILTIAAVASCSDDSNGNGTPDAAIDAGPKCGCNTGEVCIRYFDGLCRSFSSVCRVLPPNCQQNPCADCEGPICNPNDGGLSFMCHETPDCTPPDDAGVPEMDFGCYGP